MRMKVLSCELLFYASSAFVGEISKLRKVTRFFSAEPRDFAALSYRELQIEAKNRNLRAIGKTKDLLARLQTSSIQTVTLVDSPGSTKIDCEIALSPLPNVNSAISEGSKSNYPEKARISRTPEPFPSLSYVLVKTKTMRNFILVPADLTMSVAKLITKIEKYLKLPKGHTSLRLQGSNCVLQNSASLATADNGGPLLGYAEIIVSDGSERGRAPFDRSLGVQPRAWSVMSQAAQDSVVKAYAGIAPFIDSLGIEQDVWVKLPHNAQEMAAKTGAMRLQLSQVPALCNFESCLDLSKADVNGVSVISSDGDSVSVGYFTVPQNNFGELLGSPKGYEKGDSDEHHFLLNENRVSLSVEFLKDVKVHRIQVRSGVLLSGPNGVGKSAVGLLTAYASIAARQPVVYIPSGQDWVAENTPASYFLDLFVKQNADIICASDELYPVFSEYFRGNEALGTSTMNNLKQVLRRNPTYGIGVIVDEVQAITKLVRSPNAAERNSKYFTMNWYNWLTGQGSLFVRMDIASSHDRRELRLPSGEDHRLRFVDPLSKEDSFSLMSTKGSPWYIDEDKREQVYFCTGGLLRWLTFATNELRARRRSSKLILANIKDKIKRSLVASCTAFFSGLSLDERQKAIDSFPSLVMGTAMAADYKPLYDSGVVARVEVDQCEAIGMGYVEISSDLAAAAIQWSMTSFSSNSDRTRSSFSFTSTTEWVYEFERRVLSRFSIFDRLVSTKTLEGADSAAVRIFADYPVPFRNINETATKRFYSILFRPLSETFPVDAIIIPADDKSGPIYVFEASITKPRDSVRVAKYMGWFERNGTIDELQALNPDRDITILICYDNILDATNDILQELNSAALLKKITIRVLDKTALSDIAVNLN